MAPWIKTLMKQLYRFASAFLFILFFRSTGLGQSITFSELNYNSDSTLNSGNWVELYNYGTDPVDISGWLLKNVNTIPFFTFPSGTTLQPGARLVAINDSTKFISQYPFVSNFIGTLPFNFGNNGDQVRLLDNSGIVKVFMEYADSTPWYTAADGAGRTLELLDAAQSPDSASNWFVGCMSGSPGTAFIPCNDPVVFGEINYHSDSITDAGDWVELWNHSSGYINLTGWSFKDSHDDNIYNFPANIQLAPDARLVLVHDTAKFLSRHSGVTNRVGPFDFNISNAGELIRLFDHTGKLNFSIVYNNHGGWPDGADGLGYTLELIDPNSNMNDPDNWFDGCPEGSPGVPYNPNCNIGIQNVLIDKLRIISNLTHHSILIDMPAADILSGEFQVLNIMGEVIFSGTIHTNPVSIDVGTLSAGLYFAAIRNGKKLFTGKFIVP
ncbi:MAG: lamin tail domain-containing protein [Chitinophagales bacterium]